MEARYPRVWLGQSADTSCICSSHVEFKDAPFLTSLGCVIRRPSLKRTHFNHRLRSKLGVMGPLMIDSGGFALSMRPHLAWTVDNVAECIAEIEADVFVNLDFPPHSHDTARDREIKIVASMRNFEVLSDRFLDRIVMPVIHGRTMLEIDMSLRLLNATRRKPSWVGLGGMVPLLQRRGLSPEMRRIGPEVFIARVLSLMRREFPLSAIHVFGAGGTRTFPAVYALGANSADSIGWRQAAGFGSIFLPLKSQRVIAWSDAERPPRQRLNGSDLAQLEMCACPMCRSQPTMEARLSGLKGHFYNRSIHNAWTVTNQVAFWPKGKSGMISRIADGLHGAEWAKAVGTVG